MRAGVWTYQLPIKSGFSTVKEWQEKKIRGVCGNVSNTGHKKVKLVGDLHEALEMTPSSQQMS